MRSMMSKFFFVIFIIILMSSCSKEDTYLGCGFSISKESRIHIKKYTSFESLSYDFYDDANNVIMWMTLKNEAFAGIFFNEKFDGNTKELSDDFILLFTNDNIFDGLDTLQNKMFVSDIYGSKLNRFPIYADNATLFSVNLFLHFLHRFGV